MSLLEDFTQQIKENAVKELQKKQPIDRDRYLLYLEYLAFLVAMTFFWNIWALVFLAYPIYCRWIEYKINTQQQQHYINQIKVTNLDEETN